MYSYHVAVKIWKSMFFLGPVRQKSLPAFEDSDQQLLSLSPKVKQASLFRRFLVRYEHENKYLMKESQHELILCPQCLNKSLTGGFKCSFRLWTELLFVHICPEQRTHAALFLTQVHNFSGLIICWRCWTAAKKWLMMSDTILMPKACFHFGSLSYTYSI